MRDLPSASLLLALAAEAREEDAALVQRARDIARREDQLGDGRYGEVRQALAALYGPGEDGALLVRLAADIRAGRFDPPATRRLLRRLVRLRLEESNPDFITSIWL
jgi:hypothetical protein